MGACCRAGCCHKMYRVLIRVIQYFHIYTGLRSSPGDLKNQKLFPLNSLSTDAVCWVFFFFPSSLECQESVTLSFMCMAARHQSQIMLSGGKRPPPAYPLLVTVKDLFMEPQSLTASVLHVFIWVSEHPASWYHASNMPGILLHKEPRSYFSPLLQ